MPSFDPFNRRPGTAQETHVLSGIKAQPTTAAGEAIQREITAFGKISFSRFQDLCLAGENGYYASGVVDFRTNGAGHFDTCAFDCPLFCAGVGKHVLHVWNHLGRPKDFEIVEIGGGNASLAHNMLAMFKELYPEFYESIRYNILDINAQSIAFQPGNKLEQFDGKVTARRVNILTEHPVKSITGVYISNELLDAFPVERIRNRNGKYEQCHITIQKGQWAESWLPIQREILFHMQRLGIKVLEGLEVPVNINAQHYMNYVHDGLKRGATITIDYGELGINGLANSVRCFGLSNSVEASEGLLNAFQAPGKVDITTDVDFLSIAKLTQENQSKVAYNGTQAGLLIQAGISDLIAPYIKDGLSLETTQCVSGLKNLGRLYVALNSELRATITTKGIGNINLVADAGELREAVEGFRQTLRILISRGFEIPVGKEHKRAYIVSKDGKKGRTHYEVDKNGNVSLPVHVAENVGRITDENGRTLVELSDLSKYRLDPPPFKPTDDFEKGRRISAWM